MLFMTCLLYLLYLQCIYSVFTVPIYSDYITMFPKEGKETMIVFIEFIDNIDNKYYIYPESPIINRVTTNYHGGYIGVRTHGYFLSCLIPIIGSQ